MLVMHALVIPALQKGRDRRTFGTHWSVVST